MHVIPPDVKVPYFVPLRGPFDHQHLYIYFVCLEYCTVSVWNDVFMYVIIDTQCMILQMRKMNVQTLVTKRPSVFLDG